MRGCTLGMTTVHFTLHVLLTSYFWKLHTGLETIHEHKTRYVDYKECHSIYRLNIKLRVRKINSKRHS